MNATIASTMTTTNAYGNLTDNVNTTRTYQYPFDSVGITISASILLPMSVFGMLANILTLTVIIRSVKLRSVFKYFIASLCVSDFLSAALSPLYLYRRTWGFDRWTISSFACKTLWAGDAGTSVATAFHILFFSLIRLISISAPFQYKRIRENHAKICIFAIWLLAVGCGFIPFAIWSDALTINRTINAREALKPSCSINREWFSQFKTYTVAGYTIFYYIPIVLVFIFSLTVATIFCVRRRKRVQGGSANVRETRRQLKENRAILQLLLIVGSFMLGYLPHTAFHLFVTSRRAVTQYDWEFRWWFGMVDHMCLRLSECLNPIFYNLGSRSMRHETITFLRKVFRCSTPK